MMGTDYSTAHYFDLHLVTFVEAQWPMVSAFVPEASGPGSSPGRGHCTVFLGKTLDSHSASLHPGV